MRAHTESSNITLHKILIHKSVDLKSKDLEEIKGVEWATIQESSEDQIYNDVKNDCILKQQDIILINTNLKIKFYHFEFDHLPRTKFDHTNLLLTCEDRNISKNETF